MGLPTTFVKETIEELHKVTWPTRDQVVRLTVTIIIVSTIVGIFIGSVDFGLTKVVESFLR
jgi:preprotein translocase subunit SecE